MKKLILLSLFAFPLIAMQKRARKKVIKVVKTPSPKDATNTVYYKNPDGTFIKITFNCLGNITSKTIVNG